MGGTIGLTALAGGILIGAALLYGWLANRRRSGADRRRTEQATQDLYREVDRQDQKTDPDPERF